MSQVDLELKQAFAELQTKQLMTRDVFQNCERNLEIIRRLKQISSLTLREVNSLTDDVNMYESLGRCFVMAPRQEIIKHLTDKVEEYDKEEKKETEVIKVAEGKLKEAENSLRELVQQKKTSS